MVRETAAARAVGQEGGGHLLVQRLDLLDAVFVIALPRRGQVGRFEQEIGDLGQGGGHDHRLPCLVLLDELGHGSQSVVGCDGGGVELHDDHVGDFLCRSRESPTDLPGPAAGLMVTLNR